MLCLSESKSDSYCCSYNNNTLAWYNNIACNWSINPYQCQNSYYFPIIATFQIPQASNSSNALGFL